MTTNTARPLGSLATITYAQWQARGHKLYGRDPADWEFRCVHCGHVQSQASVLARMPTAFDVSQWIAYSCEGQRNPRVGCTGPGPRNEYELSLQFEDGTTLPIFSFAAEPFLRAPVRVPVEILGDRELVRLGLMTITQLVDDEE